MKKYISILVVFIFSNSVTAQQRTLTEIRNALKDYSLAHHRGDVSDYCMVMQVSGHGKSSPYYIYNDTINDGFVILSGDKRMKTILGSSDNNTFNEVSIPEALKDLLSYYAKQYDYVVNSKLDIIADERQTAAVDVPPILSTLWGQGSPYNNLCPKSCPSGCVATAMSQIMYHYKYPNKGSGIHSYISRTKGYKCSFDFENTHFEWNDILTNYGKGIQYSDANASEIASLTYACGVSVGMDYTNDGSGAYDFDVPYALINYFGYNNNVVDYYRPYFNDSEWYDIIYSELLENRPVLYCGVDRKANGGHAFIIDGCKSNGKFHINWGWDGDYNGDFELDALSPDRYSFTSQHSMVIHISPELVGEHEDLFYASKFSKYNMAIGVNTESSQYYTYKLSTPSCMASKTSYAIGTTINVRICIGLLDEKLSIITLLDSTNVMRCSSQSTFSDQDFSFRKDKLPKESGLYFIAPFVKDESNGNLTRIRTMGGKYDYISLLIKEDGADDNYLEDDEEDSNVFFEDFENSSIPSIWYQEYEKGTTPWLVKKVAQSMATSQSPIAANGFSYISLGSTNSNVITSMELKTRIYTNVIINANDKYVLTFYCRRYARHSILPDILNVQMRGVKSRTWNTLYSVSIEENDDWLKIVVPINNIGIQMLAFEGNVNIGNAIFLDQIIISKQNSNIIEDISFYTKNYSGVYSTDGIRRKPAKGINIMRMNDGEIRKILIK